MAKNPLDPPSDGAGGWIGKQPGMTEEDLRQWAADKNRFAERIGADWWYSVQHIQQPDGGRRWEVVKQEGWAAITARAKAKGVVLLNSGVRP